MATDTFKYRELTYYPLRIIIVEGIIKQKSLKRRTVI